MALNANAVCPGGTGKKIKFCCSDLLGELEKLHRMVEGAQYQAGLDYARRLLEKFPDRACLMATECLCARMSDQLEAAQAAAARFLDAHPRNPLAWAETAILTAVTAGARAAMEPLQRALEYSGPQISGRVYETLWTVGQLLVLEREFHAAQAVLSLQAAASGQDQRPMELLVELHRSRDIPVWVRDVTRLKAPPADAPWKAEFEEAQSLFRYGLWSKAAQAVASLAARFPDASVLWHNLALLRAWSADRAGAAEAFRRYACLAVPLEDAVEAEACALYLSDDPLGDKAGLYRLEYVVEDAEGLQLALSSAPWARSGGPVRVSAEDEDGPPPRAVFLLCDRPSLPAEQVVSLESVSRILGVAALYGRETDRPARLVVLDVQQGDLEPLKSLLASIPGSLLPSAPKQQRGAQISATWLLLNPEWALPRDLRQRQLEQLLVQNQREALLGRWLQLPLGALDGKTPQQAAADPALHRRLLAAILLVEAWQEPEDGRFDFNELRTRLGLPTLEPIDPEGIDLDELPGGRLSRVVAKRLSDPLLLAGYQRAMALNNPPAMRNFAQALVDRPGLGDPAVRAKAYSTLAMLEHDTDRALEHLQRGRKEWEAAGASCATWDLCELPVRVRRREAGEFNRLFHHICARHIREPGVASTLRDLLVQFGLLRPDGRLAPSGSSPPQPPGPASGTPEPGKLWLPEGQHREGEKPRIWTPGMD